ncbi:hypothetical protein [Anaerotignum propionicum]|uniref:hypothetical protein n=1 Tax=Anaerotignum propionicum TaxID=28446 RepID=UPI002F412B45
MKMADYSKGRNDGLALALKIVKEGGIEALEKEVKFRGVTNIHTPLAQKDLEKALAPIKEHTIKTILAMSIHVLYDEFDFRTARLSRFRERFNLKVACLLDDLVSWDDIVKDIEKKTKIVIALPNDK